MASDLGRDVSLSPPADALDSEEAGRLVIRGGALRTLSYVAGALLSAGSAALVARHLGPASFGRYVTVFSLVSIVGAVTEAGMSSLGVREYAQRRGADRDDLMRVLLGLRVVLTVMGVIGAMAFAVAAGYRGALLAGTALAGIGLFLTTLQIALMVPLQAELRLGTVALLEFLRQAFVVILLIALVAADAGLAALLGAPVPVGLALLAVTAWLVRGLMPLRPAWAPRAWAGLLKVTIAFALANAVGTIYVYTSQLVMSLKASDLEIGYFGVSFRIFLVVAAIPGLLVNSAFPVLARAARDDQVRLAYALQRLFDVALLVGGLTVIVTIIGAPVAVDIIGGGDYDPAVSTLRIQGIAMLFSFLLATWGFALISLHRQRALLVANALAFAISAGLTLALAPSHGADGAAIATVVGEGVLAVGYLAGLIRGRPDLRPDLGRVPRILLASGAAAGAALVSGLDALPAALLAAVVYIVGVVALRTIPDELVPARLRRAR